MYTHIEANRESSQHISQPRRCQELALSCTKATNLGLLHMINSVTAAAAVATATSTTNHITQHNHTCRSCRMVSTRLALPLVLPLAAEAKWTRGSSLHSILMFRKNWNDVVLSDVYRRCRSVRHSPSVYFPSLPSRSGQICLAGSDLLHTHLALAGMRGNRYHSNYTRVRNKLPDSARPTQVHIDTQFHAHQFSMLMHEALPSNIVRQLSD